MLVAAGGRLGLHQARILNHRSSLGREGVENIVAYTRDISRGKTRVHVKRSHHLGGGVCGRCRLSITSGLYLRLAQRDTNHGAEIVGHNALPARQVEGLAGVCNHELGVGLNCLIEDGVRNRLVVQ